MPFYPKTILVPANDEVEVKVEIRGKEIARFRVKFPPGPEGTLEVQLFYGNMQIYPTEMDDVITGDDEVIECDDPWTLPEDPCTVRILAVNKDPTNEHKCWPRIQTRRAEPAARFTVTPEGMVEIYV